MTEARPNGVEGPPPAHGSIQIERVDGPADFYLLRLTGKIDAILDVAVGHSVIKVGMSNNAVVPGFVLAKLVEVGD